jgi:hypothetical protein
MNTSLASIDIIFTYFVGVGVALLVDLFLTCLYVAPLVCHFGMYAIISMIEQPYVWSSCDNEWNSEGCVDIHKKE